MLSFGVYTRIYFKKKRTTLVISGSTFEPEKSWRTVPARTLIPLPKGPGAKKSAKPPTCGGW